MISDIILTPLKKIFVAGGDVLQGMKQSDAGFNGFGESYFSTIEQGVIKGWKRHREMTLNLMVPIGAVRFVIYDDRWDSISIGEFQEMTLSREENYIRLTIPPMLWFGFQGAGSHTAMLLNIADIEHSADEVDRKELSEIYFDWGEK